MDMRLTMAAQAAIAARGQSCRWHPIYHHKQVLSIRLAEAKPEVSLEIKVLTDFAAAKRAALGRDLDELVSLPSRSVLASLGALTSGLLRLPSLLGKRLLSFGPPAVVLGHGSDMT